ncbi:phosphoribosylglycinamide formyltransferase [Romeria aff. gracilis LEGE 07310]|uniref:Phosphoribosylglycinamide formyltransferase n=1 Tax=Vasconcelosia minhoensis LEGE 07310 TaxID=915328 RepID=A0A8J7DN66_9CYAN|nr:phosphoribosylglycinamide formyltransferase [Romeria gracilis]MBE9077720.1 phosphoribosylglycinamide formyltransferase [Romeria aff. gracilis LEGE 07310]
MTQLSANDTATHCLISPPGLHELPPPELRLGVLASGNGSNFSAILAAIAAGQLRAEVTVVVYNNPTAKVAERAAAAGIPAVLLDHRAYETRVAMDQAIVAVLRSHRVDWVIMAGWMRRVTQRLIDAFPQKILNIHPSLLPSFPGLAAVEQALTAGVKITGCTVHVVELEVDSGPIIMQAAVPVLPDDSAEKLQARIQIQEHRIFSLAIALAAQQAQKLAQQSESISIR